MRLHVRLQGEKNVAGEKRFNIYASRKKEIVTPIVPYVVVLVEIMHAKNAKDPATFRCCVKRKRKKGHM
jgi:hypothetical protein